MPDIQIASTTDDQAAVNAAAGLPPEPKEEETEQPEEVKAQTESEQPEKPKVEPSEKLKKRVDKLTAQKSAAERERDELKAKLAELEAKPAPPEKKEEPKAEAKANEDPEPKQEEFETYEAWIKAQTRWEIREEMRAAAAKEEAKKAEKAQQTEQARQNEAANNFFDRGEGKYPGFVEELTKKPLGLSDVAVGAILELENGEDVAWFLSQNRDIVNDLKKMPPIRAAAMIGKLSVQFEEKEEKPVRQGTKRGPDGNPVVSGAPPPIKPLSGHATRSAVSLDDPNLSYAEFRKIRDQQAKDRFRR